MLLRVILCILTNVGTFTEIKSLQLKRSWNIQLDIQIGFISVLHECLMFRMANPVDIQIVFITVFPEHLMFRMTSLM